MDDNSHLKSTESMQSESGMITSNGVHKEKSSAVTNKSGNNIQTVNCYW